MSTLGEEGAGMGEVGAGRVVVGVGIGEVGKERGWGLGAACGRQVGRATNPQLALCITWAAEGSETAAGGWGCT